VEKKWKRRVAGALITAALVTSTMLIGAPASAEESVYTFDDAWAEYVGVRAFWSEYGVSVGTQESLISGLLSGDPWDSMSGGKPVSVRELKPQDGHTRSLAVFQDGSIAVSGSQLPAATSKGGVGTQSVSGCRKTVVAGGTKYNGCSVHTWVGTISLSFRADFTIYTSAKDKIDAVYDKAYSFGPALSSTGDSLVVNRTTEVSGTVPAEAQYSVTTVYYVPGTSTPYMTRVNKLWLRVATNTYQDNFDVLG
jgi:hypothetical protein